ncbi:MAG: hypothetical protein IJV65_07650 [Kiritimatiellae bacterium]|nr:hypothetical protein [Kiritimatiellia bacterium]
METKDTNPATRSFDDSLACARCYAKHLAKALVLFREWREDDARDAELALCIGNIGCAEDHAAALHREADRRALHDLRERIYEMPAAVESDLQTLAAAAARVAMAAEIAERARRAAGKPRL